MEDISGEDERPVKVLVNELEVNQETEVEYYCDERTGKSLDPNKVREARAEEIEFIKNIPLYVEVDINECWEKTGKQPVSTKWVDVNKGTETEQEVRCRLVARDFKPKGEKYRG